MIHWILPTGAAKVVLVAALLPTRLGAQSWMLAVLALIACPLRRILVSPALLGAPVVFDAAVVLLAWRDCGRRR